MHARQRDGTKQILECNYRKQLELDTLVCIRGPLPIVSIGVAAHMPPACLSCLVEPPGGDSLRNARLIRTLILQTAAEHAKREDCGQGRKLLLNSLAARLERAKRDGGRNV